ncbi:hypothetical protein ACFY1P_20815 [Streptomyces sp. NPDC001407]|uniref:hypothetical protein n=1 Tax=Streptomyces sp. NPDC001407 TaxID=3364573 RepID=UPI0036C47711
MPTSDFIASAAQRLRDGAPISAHVRSEIARFMEQAAADDGHMPEEPEARRCAVRIAAALETDGTKPADLTDAAPVSTDSLLGAIRRDGRTDPVLVVITPDRIELRTLDWFSAHWSREAGHSRARRHEPLFFRLLAPGTVRPQGFSVHGERHHGHAYAEGRRFLCCTAVITTAPEYPADQPQHYPFRYWQHDPAPGEPPITDVETYALPR